MLSNVMRVKSQSFIGGGGGGGGKEGKGKRRKSNSAEQHYVLFKELEAHLGLSLTPNGT